MEMVRWGVLSSAKIGVEKVIPAMQESEYCSIIGIASRHAEKAKAAATQLGLPKSYSSYQDLISDPEIDAVYIPLPNNMHVEWAVKSLEAGKHVLCEKPIGLSAQQAQDLANAAAKYPHLKTMEAFMYRFHPQWQFAKKLIGEGRIGDLRSMQCFFSYFNADPGNIRNKPEAGGGGLMDIGCYCISQSRYIFGSEPLRAMGLIEFDPEMKTDRLASGILEFRGGHATFTCSTQLTPYQRVNILGTKGRIEVEIPVNSPNDMPTRIWLHTAGNAEEITFGPCNQYTLQGDEFSKAIINNTPVPTSLQDSVNNMKVIDALLQSNELGAWVRL